MLRDKLDGFNIQIFENFCLKPMVKVENKRSVFPDDDTNGYNFQYIPGKKYIVWWPSPMKCTYDSHGGNNVKLYNDASENAEGTAGAFCDIDDAIDKAQHFIFIADWSFHPYVKLTPKSEKSIGIKLLEWANANTGGLVAIHTWNHTNVAAKDDQNDCGEEILKEEMISRLGLKSAPANFLWRASSRAGYEIGWSHHQKFIVMDYAAGNGKRGIRTFLGGLDLTKGRFDWPEHPLYPTEKYFRVNQYQYYNDNKDKFIINEWYNAEFLDTKKWPGDYPRQTWHDIHCKIEGPAAWDVLREFVGRWRLDPASTYTWGDNSDESIKLVVNKFSSLLRLNNFVQQDAPVPPGKVWRAQIYRSIHKDHWADSIPINTVYYPFTWKWDKDMPNKCGDPGLKERERSIQEAYRQAISQAEKFIYIETQYFIGSGNEWEIYKYIKTPEMGGIDYINYVDEIYPPRRPSVKNSIPYMILERIKKSVENKRDFHVYLILPMFPEGNPADAANQGQRDLQWRSIEMIVRGVQKQIDRIGLAGKGWRNYLTIGFLANWQGIGSINMDENRMRRVNNNKRYMIYVHSKMMIVDDRYIIIGSANLNERSLAGDRDTEICVGLRPDFEYEEIGERQIRDFRYALWKEHFVEPDKNGNYPEETYWANPEKYEECAKLIQDIGKNNYQLLNEGKHVSARDNILFRKAGHFCCWDINGDVNGLGLRDEKNLKILDGFVDGTTGDDWYIWPTSYTDYGKLIE